MKERTLQILKLSLTYTLSNLDDILDDMRYDEDGNEVVSIHGEKMELPTEEEVKRILKDVKAVSSALDVSMKNLDPADAK